MTQIFNGYACMTFLSSKKLNKIISISLFRDNTIHVKLYVKR